MLDRLDRATTREEVVEVLRMTDDVTIGMNYVSPLNQAGRFTMSVMLSHVSPHIRHLKDSVLLDHEILSDTCDSQSSGRANRTMWLRFIQYLINIFEISKDELYEP